tara:strand:- start:1734 stop:4064 length:2331 start_codon:yes stop_codon:yes gene_type:complete
MLLGVLFSTPIVAFANIKPPSSLKSDELSQSQHNENIIDAKQLKHLHNEGAISTKDAERLINNGLIESSQRINLSTSIDPKRIELSNKNQKVQLKLNESRSNIKLKLMNLNNIKKSEIFKSNSGWQIVLELPEDRDIDISTLPKGLKKISEISINRFNKKTYFIKIVDNENYITKRPTLKKGKDITIEINLSSRKSIKKRNFNFPFLNRFKKKNEVYNNVNEAIAPPLGDIASGSLVLENRGFIKLNGPRQSLSLNNDPAKYALMKMAQDGGYGFILASDSTNKQAGTNARAKEINDSPFVTLSFVDEDYSIAFNSILLASGLQAKKNGNLIIVGKNVLGKSFGPKLSKVYRLNQSSASSAADYLATLGASISKVDTITGKGTGSQGASNNSSPTFKYIDSYSSSTGPLVGLTGTTDSRLQSITLVGSSELILIAEKYLKQLDLRQRQVALSVKILDVELSNSDSLSNDSAFRTGSTFIVSEKGKLFSAFGNFIPPKLSTASPAEKREYNQQSSIEKGVKTETNTVTNTLTTSLIPNPGWQYTANELYNFLVAQIRSSETKVLANPTLILSESTEKIEGGAEIVGDMNSGQASIGRPFANESFVTLGTNVITDYKTSTSEEGGTTTCEAEFSTAGLTFGARVNKIDDNGFVTFSLSPKLTSVSEIIDIPNCGPINILSVRRLDTGTLRVKDSQTLILTGVISNLDSEVITKTPILGDIPILGRLFKSTAGSKRKSELIILVTPKIIDDSDPENSTRMGIDIKSNVEDSKKQLEKSL